MIDFELYRIFVAVAEEKNITKASEKLNISQPAITKQIKNLENQLGYKLLERKSKGVELTLEGKALYEKLKNPIEELSRIDIEVGREKFINIGTHNHMGSCIFGEIINNYYLKYPNVTLNLVCEETPKMMKKLQNKEIDIVFSKKEKEELEGIKLGYLHDIILASQESIWAKQELTLEKIENQIIYTPRTYAQSVTRLKEKTFDKNLKLKNASYKTILAMASKADNLGLVTKEYIDPTDMEKLKLVEVKTSIELGKVEFGIYSNNYRFKELNEFIKMIKKFFSIT